MGSWSEDTINRLSDALDHDKVVVFFGSGLSIEDGLPDWDGLIAQFLTILDNPVYNPGLRRGMDQLQRLNPSEKLDYLRNVDRQAFDEVFKRIFPRERIRYHSTKAGEMVVKLGVNRYVTSNYDFCFEASLSTAGFAAHAEMKLRTIDLGAFDGGPFPVVCHVHGTCEDRVDDVVITDGQYESKYRDGSDLHTFFESLFSGYMILFIGFGFNDHDILRTIRRYNAFSNKSGRYQHVALYSRLQSNDESAAFKDYARRQWSIDVNYYDVKQLDGRPNHDHLYFMLQDLVDTIKKPKLGVLVERTQDMSVGNL